MFSLKPMTEGMIEKQPGGPNVKLRYHLLANDEGITNPIMSQLEGLQTERSTILVLIHRQVLPRPLCSAKRKYGKLGISVKENLITSKYPLLPLT